MKKSVVMLALLISAVILSLSATASVFEWSVFVEGGEFDRSIGGGCSRSCTTSQSYQFPQNSYLYHAQGGDGGSDSCSHSGSATVESGVYSGSFGGLNSRTFDYEPVTSISGSVNGRDDEKWFKGGQIRKKCHYNFFLGFRFGVQIYNENYFVNRRSRPLELQSLRPRIPAGVVLGPSQYFHVYSHNPKVMMWFGTPDSYNLTTTTDRQSLIYACEDVDENDICDYVDEESCIADGGDWYGGACCGVDVGFEQCSVHTNFVRTTAGGTTLIANFTPPRPAICGINADGDWEWAYIEDVGNIHELTQCPELNLVSDGTDYYYCGDNPQAPEIRQLSAKQLDILDVTFGAKTHQFICHNNKITECPGDDLAMSALNTAALGEVLQTSQGQRYCTDSGRSSVDLDTEPIACSNAIDTNSSGTEKWTGHYCCSENLDSNDQLESYNDPFDPNAFYSVANSSAGGCFEQRWIQTGSWLVADKVINAQGVFWGCNVNDPSLMNVMDTHTNVQVIQTMNTCDKVHLGTGVLAQDTLGNTGEYAVCQPWGEITITENAEATIPDQIEWDESLLPTNGQKNGCCPANQCWNGMGCQDKGTYYQVGSDGFACN